MFKKCFSSGIGWFKLTLSLQETEVFIKHPNKVPQKQRPKIYSCGGNTFRALHGSYILDGNSEHVAHVNKSFREQKIRLITAVITHALNRSNDQK